MSSACGWRWQDWVRVVALMLVLSSLSMIAFGIGVVVYVARGTQ